MCSNISDNYLEDSEEFRESEEDTIIVDNTIIV